ncbi:LLM class flavin-dependent oxidoreductase [Actinocrinis sp.]|uniref:LLM class flavin-dependent oxidoreductase n=1 Tax=Actinocrinis sp. TaxID=1920516 RepID=UPI002CBD75FB|nr:LLM class flavin-dependent oxidoreductase [Actinocrinis sp.]HXR70281.1 LLM class flavin-dependent oxidoreductase [Actinocrinis sp.]
MIEQQGSASSRRLGVMFDRSLPPESLVGFAREVEAAGADDLWVVEDLRWAGSIASAATVLAATDRLRVGIGIAPAPLRNPALLAMEFGTLARLYPDRLAAGIGHGAPDWMAQVGAAVPHKLALLEETITAVQAILRGEEVSVDGRAIHLENIRLVHPPQQPPPVIAGVIGPRSLELSGRVADGTLVVEGRGPDDLPGIRALIEKGRAAAGNSNTHELVIFTHLCVSENPAEVQEALAPVLAEYSRMLGVPESEVFTVSGNAAQVAQRVRQLWDAGVDSVILRPVGDQPARQFAEAVAAVSGS